MAERLVRIEARPPAMVVALHRPEKRNALNRQLIVELQAAFAEVGGMAACRAVILTGDGPAFCAGMDLAELAQTLEHPNEAEVVQQDARRLADLYDTIYRFPLPTIAAVHGPAVAGGAGLVTVCDLALAAPEARFGYPEARRGLVAAMVMPHLLRHVGERAARDLLLRAELVDAYEAWRMGLINDVVAADALMDTALSWARSISASGPGALARTKELLAEFNRSGLPKDAAARGSADARLTVECKSGLRAFLNRTPAPWEVSK